MDFYDLMGVAPDAAQEDIQRAFRRRVREYHPDRNDDPRAPAQFIALKKAYDTLGDPKERDAYDRLGHEAYVSDRISGLPSVETWATAEDDAHVAPDDPDEVAAGGPDTDAAGSGWSPDAGADAVGNDHESEVDPDFEFDFDFDFEFDSDDAGDTAGASAGTTVDPDQGSSTDGFVIDADGPASDLAGGANAGGAVRSVEVSKSPTASGAGTARGPKTAPETDPDPEESASSDPSIPEEYVEDDAEDDTPTLEQRVRDRARWLFGWPLVGLADVVYLGALAAVYVANTDGVASLAAAVRADGLSVALESGYGITGPGALVGGALTGGVPPLVGGTVLLGLALLPSVYCLLVWWTRRHSQWDPSYLYAAGAAVPVAWTVVSAVGVGGSLAVDLLAYVAVPVATMGAMVFFRILLPRGVRLVRQYRYRLLN